MTSAPIPGPAAPPFPWLCAHRGLSHACPENTLPAFAAAIAVGAHEIEFDVRLSRDAVPVICHDDSVDRVADGTGRISELTWPEIQRLDAGAHHGAAWRGVRLPRLEEVLRLAAGRVGLNIHIKPVPDDGATIRLVCGLLTRFALARTACLSLETDADMQTARDHAPEIARNCLITQDRPAESLAAARRHQCRRIQFFTGVADAHIREAHAAGLVCNLFYADDPTEARAQAERGIDVILTNCAHTLIAAGFARRPGVG